MEYQIGGVAGDCLSQEERGRLVGLCRRLTGNADAAEDLAQETLLLAWRSLEGLREPEKRAQWIAGIARNVSLRWLRQQGRVQAHSLVLSHSDEGPGVQTLEELVADEFDLEVELERRELVTLLDRALALLPEETREVLVRRYIEESPLAEIAARLETNASAVTMRLQRGKLALRKVLTDEFQAELTEYTRVAGESRWERTSLWCHNCGQHRLLGYKEPERGLLYLKCPACCSGDEVLSKNEDVPLLKGIKSYKPAYTRLSQWCHAYYRQGLREGTMRCDTCGHTMRARISPREEIRQLLWLSEDKPTWTAQQKDRVVNITCERCNHVNCISLEGLVLCSPEGQSFLQAHPRIRLLPERSIEFAGRPAIVTHFASVLDSASFEVISDNETFQVLEIIGGGK